MKGIVNIFGGIGTKINYFKYAIEVYKQHDFEIQMYESKNMSSLIPKQYKKNVDKSYNYLVKENIDKMSKIPKIIHTNSGGLWSGLELNAKLKHNGFIIEAGPLSCYNLEKFSIIIKNKFMVPIFLTNYLMRLREIPLIQYNPEWFEKYERQILKLPTTTILNGDKDDYLDREYIKKFVSQLQEKQIEVNNVNFKAGTHHRIAKTDIELYQKTIDEMCINAKKSVI
jgi:hypothetical protein